MNGENLNRHDRVLPLEERSNYRKFIQILILYNDKGSTNCFSFYVRHDYGVQFKQEGKKE